MGVADAVGAVGAADASGEAQHLGSSLLFPGENVRAQTASLRARRPWSVVAEAGGRLLCDKVVCVLTCCVYNLHGFTECEM